MRKILLFTLAVVASAAFAQQSISELNLWKNKQAGWRVDLSIDDLPAGVFSTKVEEVVIVDEIEGDDSELQSMRAKIMGLPISGIVWSAKATERRVLIGDLVMREGQAIPAYVFGDGKYYNLIEISQGNLRFSIQQESFADPIEFDIKFSLTDPVSNSSEYGTTSSSSSE